MIEGTIIYEGRTKVFYETDDPNVALMRFKDDVVAFRHRKQGIIPNKGKWSCEISNRLFEELESAGIPTHFLQPHKEAEVLVRRLEMIPILLVVRNVAAGVLATRFQLAEGTPLENPIIELYVNNRKLHNPWINRTHIEAIGLANLDDVDQMIALARRVNDVLVPFFDLRGLALIDFRLEFGLIGEQVVVADEITPDTCRLWDMMTMVSMDKDRFRQDLDQVAEAYEEVRNRICLSALENCG